VSGKKRKTNTKHLVTIRSSLISSNTRHSDANQVGFGGLPFLWTPAATDFEIGGGFLNRRLQSAPYGERIPGNEKVNLPHFVTFQTHNPTHNMRCLVRFAYLAKSPRFCNKLL